MPISDLSALLLNILRFFFLFWTLTFLHNARFLSQSFGRRTTLLNVLLKCSLGGFRAVNDFFMSAVKAQGLFLASQKKVLVSKGNPENLLGGGMCFSELYESCFNWYTVATWSRWNISPHSGRKLVRNPGRWKSLEKQPNPLAWRTVWLSLRIITVLWNWKLRFYGVEQGSGWFLIDKQAGSCFTASLCGGLQRLPWWTSLEACGQSLNSSYSARHHKLWIPFRTRSKKNSF